MKVVRRDMPTILVLVVTLIGVATAAEGQRTPDDGSESASVPASEPTEVLSQETEETKRAEAARRKAAKRKVVAGLIIVGGLLVLGVAVLVLTVLWAHRLRRIARQDLPTQHCGDDLWYLRPSKTTLPRTNEPDATTDSEQRSDDQDGDATS
jgi:hypothetical protein